MTMSLRGSPIRFQGYPLPQSAQGLHSLLDRFPASQLDFGCSPGLIVETGEDQS